MKTNAEIKRDYRVAGIVYIAALLVLLVLRTVLKYYVINAEANGITVDETKLDVIFTMVLQFGTFIVATSLFFKFLSKKSLKQIAEDSSLRKPRWWMIAIPFLMGVLIIFSTMGFSFIWQIIIVMLGYRPSASASAPMSTEMLFLTLFLSAVMPAIGEEFLYRGMSLTAMKEYGGFWWAVAVSSVAFGLGHVFISQSFYTIVLGGVMAYMTLKFKNILPAMILHFMNNGMSVLFDFYSTRQGFIKSVQDFVYNKMVENTLPMLGGLFLIWVIVLIAIGGLLVLMNKLHLADSIRVKSDIKGIKEELRELKEGAEKEISIEERLYPRPLIRKDGEKYRLNISLGDNAFILGGFIMAFIGTLATFVAGIFI